MFGLNTNVNNSTNVTNTSFTNSGTGFVRGVIGSEPLIVSPDLIRLQAIEKYCSRIGKCTTYF